MLGKIALTLIVIILAAVWLRKRARREKAATSGDRPDTQLRDGSGPWHNARREQAADPTRTANAPGMDLRIGAWVTLAVILGVGATLYYLSWQDARTPVTVVLHRDGAEEPVTYQVRKKDLDERSFVTVEGVQVNVSANERMEIIGL